MAGLYEGGNEPPGSLKAILARESAKITVPKERSKGRRGRGPRQEGSRARQAAQVRAQSHPPGGSQIAHAVAQIPQAVVAGTGTTATPASQPAGAPGATDEAAAGARQAHHPPADALPRLPQAQARRAAALSSPAPLLRQGTALKGRTEPCARLPTLVCSWGSALPPLPLHTDKT
ncbi:hypothetical protein ANN_07442 [Periplaneta americana]|uniref:Uncharacterized protein n=1 Tax=Periplaneta americana TaxID=6978 RepID=A0ABQ8T0W7_PERAM|nr:hypothetical protein ANN_07442 [Periplaneta americana]